MDKVWVCHVSETARLEQAPISITALRLESEPYGRVHGPVCVVGRMQCAVSLE
jgi:hypothetical protein